MIFPFFVNFTVFTLAAVSQVSGVKGNLGERYEASKEVVAYRNQDEVVDLITTSLPPDAAQDTKTAGWRALHEHTC